MRIATQIVADAFQHNCDLAIIVSADSDMIPAVELAKEAKINVFIYFPPHQYSSNLATMGNGAPIQMLRYGFELSIPTEWKVLQRGEK